MAAMPLQQTHQDRSSLRFGILDEDDLKIMSAHLQDADLKLGDMAYLPASHCFALVACRIDWDSLASGKPARRETGFHFARVDKVRRIGFEQNDPELALQLLAVSFVPGDAPGGAVLLTFAGGRMIRLDVECIDAEMRDLGPCWSVERCPKHDLDDLRAAS